MQGSFYENVERVHPSAIPGLMRVLGVLRAYAQHIFWLEPEEKSDLEFAPWHLILALPHLDALRQTWAKRGEFQAMPEVLLSSEDAQIPNLLHLFLPPWMHLKVLWVHQPEVDFRPLLVAATQIQILWSQNDTNAKAYCQALQSAVDQSFPSGPAVLDTQLLLSTDARLFAGIFRSILHCFAGRYHESVEEFSEMRAILRDFCQWTDESNPEAVAELEKVLQDLYPPPLHKKVKSALALMLKQHRKLRRQLKQKTNLSWTVQSETVERLELMIEGL